VNSRALGSRYLLDDQIGRGGMGVVWRGRDRETGAGYAIKVLRPEFAGDPASVARFVRERTALVRFRHPNVVTLHDMIVEGDQLALVMDLVEGGDLDTCRRLGGGALPPGEACGVIAQVCDGLAAAGIVHQDLKPANVLLDRGQVRLADFGIARIVGESPTTTTGTVVGTAPYLAPEVLRGQEPAAAGDVYAAGITVYELLAGQPPFTGQIAAVMHDHLATAAPRPAGVPDRLWGLISGCLSKDPADRPTAAALARALRDPALLRDADSVPDAGPLLGAGPARSADPAPGAGALARPDDHLGAGEQQPDQVVAGRPAQGGGDSRQVGGLDGQDVLVLADLPAHVQVLPGELQLPLVGDPDVHVQPAGGPQRVRAPNVSVRGAGVVAGGRRTGTAGLDEADEIAGHRRQPAIRPREHAARRDAPGRAAVAGSRAPRGAHATPRAASRAGRGPRRPARLAG
jgi:serine/threonine-protein kinase